MGIGGTPRIVKQWGKKAAIPPEVTGSSAQPTTAGTRAGRIQELLKAHRPGTSQQHIVFVAAKETGDIETIEVLANEQAAQPTDGWAKFAHIARHGRVAMTVLEGYEPVSLEVPVLFEAVAKTKGRQHVENDIQTLEWMAGRGPKREREIPGEVLGEPPLVEVYVTDTGGNQKNLIPKQFQTVPGRNQIWYISNISFDQSGVLRSGGGERIRQPAVVTLTEYVATPASQNERRRNREKAKNKIIQFHTRQGIETVHEVAKHFNVPGAWKGILAANPKLGKDAGKPLRNHTLVKVPAKLLPGNQVPRG